MYLIRTVAIKDANVVPTAYLGAFNGSLSLTKEEGDVDTSLRVLWLKVKVVSPMPKIAVEEHHTIAPVRHSHILIPRSGEHLMNLSTHPGRP